MVKDVVALVINSFYQVRQLGLLGDQVALVVVVVIVFMQLWNYKKDPDLYKNVQSY